jgi:glycosyltransferase involved in cell wall biosynthesis
MSDLTVLIPTYNRPHLVGRAVESVLNQEGVKVKVIVSDNSLVADAAKILTQKFSGEGRLRYVHQVPSLGMVGNFNFLVGQVDTPFFAFLTDDDYQLDGFASWGIRAIEHAENAMFSVQRVPSVSRDGQKISDQLDSWKRFGEYRRGEGVGYVLKGAHPILTGCVFRSALLPEIRFFEDIGAAGDILLMVRLCAKYNFVVVDHVGAHFVLHEQSESTGGMSYSCPALGLIEERCSNDPELGEGVRRIVKTDYRRYVDHQYIISLGRALKRGVPVDIALVANYLKTRRGFPRIVGRIATMATHNQLFLAMLFWIVRIGLLFRNWVRPSRVI